MISEMSGIKHVKGRHSLSDDGDWYVEIVIETGVEEKDEGFDLPSRTVYFHYHDLSQVDKLIEDLQKARNEVEKARNEHCDLYPFGPLS